MFSTDAAGKHLHPTLQSLSFHPALLIHGPLFELLSEVVVVRVNNSGQNSDKFVEKLLFFLGKRSLVLMENLSEKSF